VGAGQILIGRFVLPVKARLAMDFSMLSIFFSITF